MKTGIVIIGMVLILVLCTGCMVQEPATPDEDIRIGVIASMSGPASSTGKDLWESAELAASKINTNGGVYLKESGKRANITLLLGDDESTREGGIKAVSKLITQEKVDALVGGFSSAVVSAHQSVVSEHGIPYVITGASTPVITHRDDLDTSMMFHYCPTTDDYGEKTILFADDVIRKAINQEFGYAEDRPLRVALILQDSPFGKGVQSAVNKTIVDKGLSIELVSQELFKMGETDFRTILTLVKTTGPDLVYSAAFLNEQIPMVTQARRDVGLNTIFLAVECNDDPDYYSGLGEYGDYSVIESRFSPYTIPAGDISQAVLSFREDFHERYGSFPAMMGASTYEGVYVIAQAMEDAGSTDKAKVTHAIDALSMPQMIEPMQDGVITFTDDFREAKFDLYMEQLFWDASVGEPRPKVVWPDYLKETDFVLPGWYEPGPE